MKKILLGTSAIVGASVLLASPVWAAEKPKLVIDGWLRFEAWGVDQDKKANTAVNRGYYFDVDDVEIHFLGSAKADNGMGYGFYVEIAEGNTDAQGNDSTTTTVPNGHMNIDEANVYLSGGWGRLDLGAQDGIQNTWKVGGYSVVADKDGAWDGEVPVNKLSTSAHIGTDFAKGAGDANKITYYSPSFGGFQAGFSFTPNTGASMNSGYQIDNTGDYKNQYAFGVRYAGTFSNVGVEVTGRYQAGDYVKVGASTTAASEPEDDREYGFGAKVSYMGFSLAGSYNDLGKGGIAKTTASAGTDNGYYWDVGLQYATGPYKVSVAYMNSEAGQGDGVQDDKVDYFSLSAGYSAAPGLDFYAQYSYVDLDQAGTTSDNNANLFLIGTQVSF